MVDSTEKIYKSKIMVVDDDEIIRELLGEVLAILGYEPVVIDSPIVAIEKFREINQEIDMIIMDMIMPQMSGAELYSAIRSIKPDQKVIILSGYSDDVESKRMMGKGVVGFVQKPVTINELSKIIQQNLKK